MIPTRIVAWSLLAVFAVAAEGEEPAEPEMRKYALKVVGVYRPIALKGRTVMAPREVYLQPISASGPLEALVGKTLEVRRRVPVPALVDFAAPKPKAKKRVKKKKKRKAAKKRRRSRAAMKRAAKERAEAEAKAKAEVEAKAQAAKQRAPRVDTVVRPVAPTVKTAPIDVVVGRIKVVTVRPGVVVAHALLPAGEGTAVAGALPAVMAGDVARLEVRPPAPPPPPSLSKAEQRRLEAERKVTEKEDHRRRHPLKKYERPKMRWKL